MSEVQSKTCKRCHQERPASEFRAHKRTRDKLGIYCRVCDRERGQEYRAERKAAGPLDPCDAKVCAGCGLEKPASAFYVMHSTRSGLSTYCRECHIQRTTARYLRVGNTPETRRKKWDALVRRRYGLTREALDALVLAHEGRCAICGKAPQRMHIDHDHVTGLVRGFLCTTCNVGLGKFGDSEAGLERALAYLRRSDMHPNLAGVMT